MVEKEQVDRFLFEELKSGNSRAFDKIFNCYYQNLCLFANSIVHDEDAAQGLVQQVFINLWETRTSLNHIQRLSPYLTTMVKNTCFNHIKREKRNINMPDVSSSSRSENTTENQVNINDFEEHLIIALTSLPIRCKMAFEYSRFENLTNREIAQKMEITVKGVEALIGRALKLLRISLAEYLPPTKSGKFSETILFMLLFRA